MQDLILLHGAIGSSAQLKALEEKLSDGQLFALRFAPDEELPALVDKAITGNLSPDAIKKSVQNWKADNRRV